MPSSSWGNALVAYSLLIRLHHYLHTYSASNLPHARGLPRLYPFLGDHHLVMSFLDNPAQAFSYDYGHLVSLRHDLAHPKPLSLHHFHSRYLPSSLFDKPR